MRKDVVSYTYLRIICFKIILKYFFGDSLCNLCGKLLKVSQLCNTKYFSSHPLKQGFYKNYSKVNRKDSKKQTSANIP